MTAIASRSLPVGFPPASEPHLRVLGPLTLHGPTAGRSTLRSPRQRALLAVLTVRAGRSVGVDELVQALWGDDWPRHPAAALQSQVHRLRPVLDDAGLALETTNDGYRLAAPGELLDSARFEALTARALDDDADPDAGASDLTDDARALARAGLRRHRRDRRRARRGDPAGGTEGVRRRGPGPAVAGRGPDGGGGSRRGGALTEHPYREGAVAVRMKPWPGRGARWTRCARSSRSAGGCATSSDWSPRPISGTSSGPFSRRRIRVPRCSACRATPSSAANRSWTRSTKRSAPSAC